MTLEIATIAATLVGLTVATAALLRWRLRIVTVRGVSMRPTLGAGDQLLVRRTTLSRVRSGDIVVLAAQMPDLDADVLGPISLDYPPSGDDYGDDDYGEMVSEAGDWVIKRAVAVPGDPVPATVLNAVNASAGAVVPEGVFVALGDNQDASFDSRSFGYVPAGALLGVAVRPFRSRRTASGRPLKDWRESQWSTS